jgi:glyoxylase-like metal-dependent hydrolase (beta-lactamase superfamily II)
MPQITPHVYQLHIGDTHYMHPGGTNIYFVGDPKEEMIIVDTGEHDRSWTKQVLDYYQELGRPKITSIVISHGHRDHTGGVDRVQEATGAPVRCHPKLAKELRQVLGDESLVVPLRSREMLHTGGGVAMRALFTPGHAVDHVCYHLAKEKVLFTGDTILGASSSSVQDLYDYMKSLSLLAKLRVTTICPAHGPVVPPPRGANLVKWYINHRNEREAQVVGALEKGVGKVDDIVKTVYPKNLKKDLRRAAAGNVRTHLDKLVKEKKVAASDIVYSLTKD